MDYIRYKADMHKIGKDMYNLLKNSYNTFDEAKNELLNSWIEVCVSNCPIEELCNY